jgi:transposase
VASAVWSSQSESCSRRNKLTGALVARRSFNVVDVTEIFIHWHAGRSQSEIATSLGVDRKTVRKYLAPAIEAGVVPGDAPRSGEAWAELVRSWWPGLVDTRLRQTTWPQIEAHREFVVEMLAAGVTQQTIWQRLRDEHGLTASVASLKRYVAANLPEDVLRSRVTVLRESPPAGEEAQIDYGYLGSWLDPVGGRLRRVWAFVMVLACSRHVFVRPVLSMDQAAWTQAHVEAFAFFGGVAARLVYENVPRNIFVIIGATDIVVERGDEGVAAIKELTGGLGAHSVIEAVGTQESMMQAIRSARPGGHVGYVGVSHDVQLPGDELFFSGVHLHGGPAPVRRFLPGLVRQICGREIDPGKVFDLDLPLDQAAEGYAAMDERRAIKTLLHF